VSAAASNASKLRLNLGSLTDAASIQQAISVVVRAVAADDLEADRARLILYGLRIASTNVKQLVEQAKTRTAVQPTESNTSEATAPEVVAEAEAETAPHATEQAEAAVSYDDETAHEPCEAVDDVTIAQPTTNEAFDDESACDSTAETAPESPDEGAAFAMALHQRNPGGVYVPPSCFASAHSYRSNARERILSYRQKRA
jgi:hypothetical protein